MFMSEIIGETEAINSLLLSTGQGAKWPRFLAWGEWSLKLKAADVSGKADPTPWEKEFKLWKSWMLDDGLDLPPYVVQEASSDSNVDTGGLLILGGIVAVVCVGAYLSERKNRP